MEVREPIAKYLVQPCLKETEVGLIPGDWNLHRLVEVAEIRSGIAKNANSTLSDPVDVPYLRVANVQDGFVDLTEVSQIRVGRADVKRFMVLPNDVLMNEGGDLDKLGRGTLWQGQINPCVHQNHVFVVRCRPGLSPRFLNAWTSSSPARLYFLLAGRQTTNLASINKSALGQLPVPVPQRESEQESIATALSDADALIESLQQLLARKRLIKQGTMQELLTGQRRLPGHVGQWSFMRLREVCRMKSGIAITSESMSDHYSFPCYGGNGLRGYAKRFTHSGSYVLIGRQGALCGNITLVEGKFYASEHAVVVDAFERTDVLWLACVLDRMKLNQYSESSAQPGLSVAKLVNLETAVPPKEEQTAIATTLADMDTEITALQARLAKARQLKQGMMQALLTGRIRLV